MNGALSYLKVIEFAEMVSGPACGKLFADMGADVIKIEPPGAGDRARRYPPFPGNVPHPEKSGLFLYLNTSKKSLTLDPGSPTGSRIFRQLVAEADILIENYRPGHMQSLGLGYEDLRALNPRLIYTSISPFGQTGPYRDWKGSDLVTFVMSPTGYNTPTGVTDPENENPLRAPGREAEMMGGTGAAASAMMAVVHRNATSVGQWIDFPCWQAMVHTSKSEIAAWNFTKIPFVRDKQLQGAGGPAPPYRCKDGFVYPVYTSDVHWRALKELLKHPEALESEIFNTVAGRAEHGAAMRMLVAEELSKFDLEYLVSEGQRLRLPIGPVYSAGEAAEHPHLAARDAFIEIDHPAAGRVKIPGASIKLSSTPASALRAPMLGEHNHEILCERLGYPKEELIAMRVAGVI